MKTIAILILLILSVSSYAVTIEYEIYNSKTGKLISSGKKEYSSKDILQDPYERGGMHINRKLIELEQGYKIGASIHREPRLIGFGLIAELKRSDFSWEWYNKKKDFLFQKLQGGTNVKVRVSGGPLLEILEEVEFLDDTKLEFTSGCKGKKESYEIIVKKGSRLKFD